ncbi:MAG: polyprenyl synthetase family protein [Nitrososphaerales archaeon]|nr:polyprenyl synthetase family protein [Nitrososphaerales archaeon]
MIDLQKEMARVKSRVDGVILKELLPRSNPIPEVDLLYKMMRDYPARTAKGLRPFLCVVACKATGGTEEDSLLTAASLEMFQHWILIHDDIEDESELRRGEPTLHMKYSKSLALNAGDALHARMWGALALNEKRLGQERTLRVMDEFSRMVNATTEGQHMELVWVHEKKWDLDESDYYEMCTRKTSWYTTASPCRLGAIVAGAKAPVLEKLLRFGLKLGVGFQIQDDVLNLVGDQSKYGKARSDDILEGKRTVMLLKLLELATSAERAKVVAIMNKPRERKSSRDVEYVVSMMRKYDTIGYASGRAKALMNEALLIADTVAWEGDKSAVQLLKAVARFTVERQW